MKWLTHFNRMNDIFHILGLFFYKQQGYRDGKETRIGLKYKNENYKKNGHCTCTIT